MIMTTLESQNNLAYITSEGEVANFIANIWFCEIWSNLRKTDLKGWGRGVDTLKSQWSNIAILTKSQDGKKSQSTT